MLNSLQTISLYENVLVITRQMLEAAQQSDWSQMQVLENRCSQHVATIKSAGGSEALSGELRDKKVQLIREILENDRAIRDITEPWLKELASMINNMGVQRKLEMTYNNSHF